MVADLHPTADDEVQAVQFMRSRALTILDGERVVPKHSKASRCGAKQNDSVLGDTRPPASRRHFAFLRVRGHRRRRLRLACLLAEIVRGA